MEQGIFINNNRVYNMREVAKSTNDFLKKNPDYYKGEKSHPSSIKENTKTK